MASSQRPKIRGKKQNTTDHKPKDSQCHPYLNLSIQQWAVIIALFSNALLIDSVNVNRDRTIQVILSGDFSKMKGAFSPNNLTDDSIALFEAIDAADEATLVQQSVMKSPHREAVVNKSKVTVIKKNKKKR